MPENKKPNMRWYILSLALLTGFFIAGMGRFSLVVLFKEISVSLDLNLVAIGTVWGMDAFAAFFICLPSGMLLDKFGIRKTAAVFCIVAGIFSILRGLAGSFLTLAATTFLYGIVAALIVSLGPKILSYYFKGRHLGLMTALVFIPVQLGQMVGTFCSATWLSPLLGGWRNVFFIYTIPSIIIGLLWLTAKNIPITTASLPLQTKPLSFKQTFSQLIRMRQLWILGIVGFTFVGSGMSLAGYLPLYLRDIGWLPADADGALTLMLAAGCIGTLPLVFLSDKLKSRRLFVFTSTLIMSLAISAMYISSNNIDILLIIIISGILRGSTAALLYTLLLEIPDIRPEFMGTAAGIMSTINMLGGFVMPPVGNSFAAINPALPFVFWAALSIVSAFLLLFMKKNPGKGEMQEVDLQPPAMPA